jgi:hypothetical protein
MPLAVDVPVLEPVPELDVDEVPVPEVDVDVPVALPDELVPPDAEAVPLPEPVELAPEPVSPPEDAGVGVELEFGALATEEEFAAEFAVCELPAPDELPPQPTAAIKTAIKTEPPRFK